MRSAFYCVILNLAAMLEAGAIVMNNETGLENAAHQIATVAPANQGKLSTVHTFPYWEHVGMVGMGSGIYLGDGWVLTSAHVGCYPFVMSDGSNYKPIYDSWKVLQNPDGGTADLAIFRVQTKGSGSKLSQLGNLMIGKLAPEEKSQLIMIGTGFTERTAVTAGTESTPVVLGYQLQQRREKRWAFASFDKILEQPAHTAGGHKTRCFVSSFHHNSLEGQAADGDSGGAMFAYDARRGQWELVGCIFAASQLGTYVPFGSRTYLGELANYRFQLPAMNSRVIEMADLSPSYSWELAYPLVSSQVWESVKTNASNFRRWTQSILAEPTDWLFCNS